MQLALKIVLFILNLVLFLDERACLLLELVGHILRLCLLLPHALDRLFKLLVFLAHEVKLGPKLLPHGLVLLNDSLMVNNHGRLGMLRGRCLTCLFLLRLGRTLEFI